MVLPKNIYAYNDTIHNYNQFNQIYISFVPYENAEHATDWYRPVKYALIQNCIVQAVFS